MPFKWSLNPYMGCVHRCTFCYVRHFEQRADRPSDDRLRPLDPRQAERRRGAPPRARAGLLEARGRRARDGHRPVPARRGSLPAHARLPRRARRGVDAVLDRHARAARRARHRRAAGGDGRARRQVFLSLPTLDERVWRTTEPGTAPPASRLEAVRRLAAAGIDVGVGIAPILPGLSDDPSSSSAVVRAARDAGARTIWASVVHLRPGVREHFLEALGRDWPEEVGSLRGALREPRVPPVARHAHRSWSPYARRTQPCRALADARAPGIAAPRQLAARCLSEEEPADARRRIATWPTRSPASSPTTTRSCAKGSALRSRARRGSA